MIEPLQEHAFYRTDSTEAGLRFGCTRCSACCRFDSGYVWLTRSDLSRLASGLGMSPRCVVERYCRVVEVGGFAQVSLDEKTNLDCVFWIDGSCAVYEYRPVQCRSFPFWEPYLESRSAWDALESVCPGVNCGTLHPPGEIDGWVELRRSQMPLNADTLDGADTMDEVNNDEG